jgi:hypothetical protein
MQQAGLLVVEAPLYQTAHVHDADHATLDQERDAEERAHPRLADERVQHFGAVDVVHHERATLGSDTIHEPAPDRNGDLALARFLEPHGGPRDERPVLPEHKDRRRVDLEHVADTGERLAQQVVQREMRERGVGHRLQAAQRFRDPLRLGAGGLLAAALLLELLPFGDVADDARHDEPVRGPERREADLGGELAPILATSGEVGPHPHRPRARVGGVAGPVTDVCGPHARGQEDLDRPPE